MPNVNRVSGFKPIKHLSGATWNGQFQVMIADTNALNVGDLVKSTGTADGTTGYNVVTRITAASDTPVGVVVGRKPNPANLNLPGGLKPAGDTGANALVYVVTDPTVVYEAQANAASAIADIGLNVSPSLGSVNTTTGISAMQLDMATKATTQALTLKMVEVSQNIDMDLADSANWKINVVLNQNALANNTAGV
mgnify:CR=1 FL=1